MLGLAGGGVESERGRIRRRLGTLAMERRARELGCVVDFPSERTAETSLEKGDKVHPPVVVIMLGWAGCKDRYLEKYSAIYLQKGCLVIRYTAPWRLVFFSESLGIKSMQTLAIKLLKLLFDYKVETNPLLFHVFSNDGFAAAFAEHIRFWLFFHNIAKNIGELTRSTDQESIFFVQTGLSILEQLCRERLKMWMCHFQHRC
uniref:Transmembrane protein 53 n=1 Tax=Laticauda laticaudata TaxID=8630 RepID=A0A8C5SUB7_LATLA